MGALGEPIMARASEDRSDREPAASVEDPLALLAGRAELVSALTHGLAHESRNALNALAINLEVLADKLREPEGNEVPSHLEKNLQAARLQVRRLDEAIRRFGEFATGKPESRDLAAMTRTAGALCSYHLRRLGTGLEIEMPGGLWVTGDASLVLQLMVEAVLLAADAVPGGSVLLETTSERPTVTLRISVEGVGVVSPPAEDSELLEPLRPIVEGLGGELQAMAGVGKGWEITLPFVDFGRPGLSGG